MRGGVTIRQGSTVTSCVCAALMCKLKMISLEMRKVMGGDEVQGGFSLPVLT